MLQSRCFRSFSPLEDALKKFPWDNILQKIGVYDIIQYTFPGHTLVKYLNRYGSTIVHLGSLQLLYAQHDRKAATHNSDTPLLDATPLTV